MTCPPRNTRKCWSSGETPLSIRRGGVLRAGFRLARDGLRASGDWFPALRCRGMARRRCQFAAAGFSEPDFVWRATGCAPPGTGSPHSVVGEWRDAAVNPPRRGSPRRTSFGARRAARLWRLVPRTPLSGNGEMPLSIRRGRVLRAGFRLARGGLRASGDWFPAFCQENNG